MNIPLNQPVIEAEARPKTRAECPPPGPNGWRECAWAGCRHHLWLDIFPRGMTRRPTVSTQAVDLFDLIERQPVCSLDVVDLHWSAPKSRPEARVEMTLGEIGQLLGVSRERVRQIEKGALDKIGAALGLEAGAAVDPDEWADILHALVTP